MKTKHTFAFTFVLGLVWSGILFAYSGGPPSAANGVIGPTCNQVFCHSSFALNSGGGSVSISGLPASWTPSATYNITVTVFRSGTPRYGFQFTAVNNASNAQAGTLSAASPNDFRVTICPGGVGCFNDSVLQFAQHNSSGNTTGIFNFRWTAPASASFGPVRFNVAGNATNNNGNPDGDFIYATSTIVNPVAGDTTPPVISAVSSSGITSSGASINWTTDEAADTQVEYGISTSYGQTATLPPLVTGHAVGLIGLLANTTYHYRVKSTDASGNLATSADFTFATLPLGDVTPPLISAVSSSGVTVSSAVVTWTTDEASDTQVEYGFSTAYGQSTALSTAPVTAHTANLNGLASNTTYHFRVKSRDAAGNLATSGDATFMTPFSISNLGGASRITDGAGSLATGYGRILATAGTTPSGLAIFGNRLNGVLVSEAGVPDSPLITSGRIYAEVSADGKVNTGIAMANPNVADAVVTFEIRNTAGTVFRSGTFTLKGINTPCDPATTICNHLPRFLDQDPFLSGQGIQGTFSFNSTAPVSVIALRGFINERPQGEFLTTTLPVLDLAAPASTGTQVIPDYAAGEGWTTQILLINPTGTAQTGNLQFLDQLGAAKTVLIDGTSGNSTAYSVAANSSRKFVITSATSVIALGSVRVVPANGGAVPTPLLIYSYKPGPFTVAEAGVPVTMGTAFRMYAELSTAPVIGTGVAIANATAVAGTVTLTLTDLSGTTIATSAPQNLPASGQFRGFLDQLIPTLANQSAQGILRISTTVSSISVVGLRGRINERQDFLITTTPPTVESGAPVATERLFPHLANGDGYTTQFILFSGTAGQTSGGNLVFRQANGTALNLNIH